MSSARADYAVDQVRRELIDHFGEERVFEEGLIVQTSIDDELQKLAERALRKGLEDYDRRHGWRGAITQIDVDRGDWRVNFEQMERPKGVGDYQLATVVRAYRNSAEVAVQGNQNGRIPLNQMTWARPWRKNQELGPAVSRVSQVLKRGDVVLVEDLDRSVGADRLFALRQIPDVNGGMVAIDPKTGEVVASVGGYSFERSQFNRVAQGKRQPGSTFKPFVYLTALNKGYRLNSSIKDQPLRIVFDTGEVWEPKNAGGSYWGNVSLANALMTSRNVPTVNIARDVTMKRIGRTAELFGFYDGLPRRLANALGSQENHRDGCCGRLCDAGPGRRFGSADNHPHGENCLRRNHFQRPNGPVQRVPGQLTLHRAFRRQFEHGQSRCFAGERPPNSQGASLGHDQWHGRAHWRDLAARYCR